MKENSSLSTVLETTLLAGRRRIHRILLARGVCTTLAVFVVSTLGVMSIDAMVTVFSPVVRWLFCLSVLFATAVAAYVSLVKPLRRLFTLAEIAALIERNHPELEERLSTAVELAAEGEAAAYASPELVAAIAQAATEDVRKVSPRREFTARTVKPRLWSMVGALFVVALLFVFFPTATSRLVARTLVPSAEVDNVYASALRVKPGDLTVLAGTSVEIGVSVEDGFPSRAFVRTSVGGRSESSERMTRTSAEGESARYGFVYPSVSESFSYRVHCGSALTRAYRVDVVPPPTYSDRRITVEHPAYTGRSADTYTNSATVVGLAGSKVTVYVRRSRPDVTGEISLADGTVVPAVEDGDRLRFAFVLAPKAAGSWSSRVHDSYGFSNAVESAAVEIVKDMPPVVNLVSPEERETRLPRTGVLPLEIEAKDDFGIVRRRIEIAVGAGAWRDLQELEGDGVRLLVSALALGEADRFRVRVRVEDNLPAELGGPNVAYSREVTVELQNRDAKSLARQDLAAEIAEAKTAAEEIRKHLERAARALEPAKDLAGEGWSRENAKKGLDRAKDELENGQGLLSELVDKLKEGRLATAAEAFEDVEEKRVIPLERAVEDIYVAESRKEQGHAGAQATQRSREMLKAFDEANRRLGLVAKKAEDLQKLADLAEREQALGEAAEAGEMSAAEIAQSEQEIARDLEQAIRDEKSTNFDGEKRFADHLMKRAEDLARRQDEIQRMSGDEQKKAEQALARDVQTLANETGDLKRNIEKKAGAPDADANQTTRPVEAAQAAEQTAADKAREASANLEKGDTVQAKSDMNAVSEALKRAQDSLANAQAKLDAKSGELGENVREMQEAQQSVAAAQTAAKEAAQAAPNEAASSQQMTAALRSAAQAMQKMARSQMAKANMPTEAFEADSQAESESDSDAQADMQGNAEGKPGKPRKNAKSGKSRPSRKGSQAVLLDLKPDDGNDWFRMKGESARESADAYDDVPAEYRSLVRDYFRALNEGGKK